MQQTVDVVATEVEVLEPLEVVEFTVGNSVEVFFHRRGEFVVDQLAEVFFEKAGDGKGDPLWNQRLATLGDIALVQNGRHDVGVGRRAADAVFFEGLNQARLGVARWRVGDVVFGNYV